MQIKQYSSNKRHAETAETMTGKCVAHGRQHGASAQSVPRNIIQNKGAMR